MRYLYLFSPNDPRIKNNVIFDIHNDPNFSIYLSAKKLFKNKGIIMRTLDKENPTKADIILCTDSPFPWNIAAWKILRDSPATKVLLAYEPPVVNPFNYMKFLHGYFKKVLTWNDELVDNEKYFKYYWPQSDINLHFSTVHFKKKKFLTLINGNKLPFVLFKPLSRTGKELYSERIRAIEYCEENIPNDFDLYGIGWNQPKKYNLSEKIFGYRKYKTYKGTVDNKITTISQYKFCICYENLTDVEGYFTEKLFDAFKARSVPIYWGASNVTEYIPKDCFIDFREFNSYLKLTKYLRGMEEGVYNKYIENIENLLKDKNFLDKWFEDGFSRQLYKLLVEDKGKD